MSDFRIELNREGVRSLLKSGEMMAQCKELASGIQQRCGSGYAVDTHTGKNRVNAMVYADNAAARRDNKYSGWTDDDLQTFRPACAYICDYLKVNHPDAKIVWILWSATNVVESVKTVCDHFGIETFQPLNVASANGHPTADGQRAIANQLLKLLR